MIKAIEEIQGLSAGLNAESLAADPTRYKAILYCFVVIGEAARMIPEDVVQRHPSIEWAGIRAMRNVVTHVYFGVDAARVHKTITEDLPPTLASLRAIQRDT